MKGTLRWIMVNADTNEYQYDLGSADFDTDKESIRDTIVRLLLNDWDGFGSAGDCIVVVEDEDENV